MNILNCQLSSSNGLGFMMSWRTGGKGLINQLINNKTVCRTALATRGLLINFIWSLDYSYISNFKSHLHQDEVFHCKTAKGHQTYPASHESSLEWPTQSVTLSLGTRNKGGSWWRQDPELSENLRKKYGSLFKFSCQTLFYT